MIKFTDGSGNHDYFGPVKSYDYAERLLRRKGFKEDKQANCGWSRMKDMAGANILELNMIKDLLMAK